jgi:P4 family phage/plasmid primase-like protien
MNLHEHYKENTPNTKTEISLSAFLNSVKTFDKKEATHYTLNPQGKYVIDHQDMDFRKCYINALCNNEKVSLVQKHTEYSPILIDLDFRQDVEQRLYTTNTIDNFINKLIPYIRRYVECDKIDCIILEKEKPRPTKQMYKDGLHIQFIDLNTCATIQNAIRNDFINDHPNIFPQYKNDIQDIYDKAVIKSAGWFVYGSMKPDETSPWLLTDYRIYSQDGTYIHKNVNPYQLRQMIDLVDIHRKVASKYTNEGYDLIAPPTPSIVSELSHTRSSVISQAFSSINSRCMYEPKKQDDIYELVNMLSQNRCDNYTDWMRVGWALYNTSPNYLPLWKSFSKKSYKYKEGECEEKWYKMDEDRMDSKITKGSLYYWAQEDSPCKYTDFRANKVLPISLEKWNGGPSKLATIARELMKDIRKDIYSIGENLVKKTFSYDEEENIWYSGENYGILQMVLEFEMKNVKAYYERELLKNKNKKTEDIIHDVNKVSQSLKSLSMLKNISAVMNQYGKDESFLKMVDSYPYLLGVNNGVIDLRTGELRPRVPTDYIMTILDIDYDPDADTSFIEESIETIMAGNHEMVNYLQKVLGYCITGEAMEELFFVFTASGRNGKSVILSAMENILDESKFFKVGHNALITNQQIGNLEVEKAALYKKRMLVFQELSPTDTLKVGELQSLTGGEKISARRLFEASMAIKPTFTPILCTNYLPEITGEVNRAILDRIKIINFPVTFTDLAVDEQPTKYRRQVDCSFKNRFSEDRQGFLKWLVTGAVKWYKHKDLKTNCPAEVNEHSKKYFDEEDKLGVFISEKCNTGMDLKVSSSVFLDEINLHYGKKIYTHKTLTRAMTAKGYDSMRARYKQINVRCFIGIELKDENIWLNEESI